MTVETDPFRIRGHVANFDAIVDGFVAKSAAIRANGSLKADIAYGDGPSETLDLFFPQNAGGNLPVHMFIHGGYWRMFSKKDYSFIANSVTAAGAIAAIVDYALMPEVRMATIVDQIRRARHWIAERIADFGGDPARLTVSGHSAGAHLATSLFEKSREPTGILAALLLGGIYDLKPLQSSFLQADIALTDEEVTAFTPMTKTYSPETRVCVLVGALETPPFHTQANAFAKRLHSQGVNVSQRIVVSRNHMDGVRDLGDPDTITGRMLVNMIKEAR